VSNINIKELIAKVAAERLAIKIHLYCKYKSNKEYKECLLDELDKYKDKYKHNFKLCYHLKAAIYSLIARYEEIKKVLDMFGWSKGL